MPAGRAERRPHRGGRPRLPMERRRSIQATVSFSPAEWAAVQERAESAAFSPRVYLRAAALGAPFGSRVDRRALAQLARAGNLLNQAVRYAHMTQRPADVEGTILSAARAIEAATRALLSS